jgi:hypothetical protein
MSTEIEYSFGSIQYEFVNDDLDRAASDPDIRWMIVVSLSTQIYIYSSPRWHHRCEERFTGYLSSTLCTKYGVDLVLSGHEHDYQWSFPL